MPGRAVIRCGRAGGVRLKQTVDVNRRADTAKLVAGCGINVRMPMKSPDLTRNKTNTQKKN
jgi:hypothetical protein